MAMYGGAWRPGDSYFPFVPGAVASTPAPVGLPSHAAPRGGCDGATATSLWHDGAASEHGRPMDAAHAFAIEVSIRSRILALQRELSALFHQLGTTTQPHSDGLDRFAVGNNKCACAE